ncbi:GNAT family N-acetyltransferase [Cellulomonas sp. URHB0016]
MIPAPVEQAIPEDAEAIHRLRRSLEDWMVARGVEQWPPGGMPLRQVVDEIADGQWHVVRDAEVGIAGALRLLWSDEPFWGPGQPPAVYVHGLMVDRRCAGRGLGTGLLDWAAAQGRAAGVGLFRLDHRTTNPVLGAYYERYGFTVVGRADFPTFSATLLELTLH